MHVVSVFTLPAGLDLAFGRVAPKVLLRKLIETPESLLFIKSLISLAEALL